MIELWMRRYDAERKASVRGSASTRMRWSFSNSASVSLSTQRAVRPDQIVKTCDDPKTDPHKVELGSAEPAIQQRTEQPSGDDAERQGESDVRVLQPLVEGTLLLRRWGLRSIRF